MENVQELESAILILACVIQQVISSELPSALSS